MPFLLIKSKGKTYKCLIDSRDQAKISRFTWSINGKGYLQTTINGRTILMHRLILGIIDRPELETDHKRHNKIDNRRSQIRVCNHSENRRNSRKLMPGSSKFKGVYKDGLYYHAQIMKGQKVINLGRYYSEITAGKVYDQAAKETFKDFAYLNFPGFKPANQLIIPGL